MKNQCRQEFEDSELDFVLNRPLLPIEATIGGFPPIKRPLHCDNSINAFEVAQLAGKTTVLVLQKGGLTQLGACTEWSVANSQYFAHNQKHQLVEVDGVEHIAQLSSLIGSVCLDLPGRFREATDDWLRSAFQRANTMVVGAQEHGLIPAFTPSLTAGSRIFAELCVAPFAVLIENDEQTNADEKTMVGSVDTYIKLLYWLIAGTNLFEEGAESAPLLSKWSHGISLRFAEVLRSYVEAPAADEVQFSEIIKELDREASKSVGTKKAEPKPDNKPGFERLAAMRQIKSQLQREVIASIKDKDSFSKYGLKPSTSVLFFGPSGCGKTLLAKSLAEEIDRLLIQVRPSDLASMYTRECVMRIRECFDDAIKNAPCALLFDEFDALVPDRQKLQPFQEFKIEEVNEILTQIDRIKEHDIFLIAATNQPFNMDRGLFQSGRFEKIIYVPPPEEDERAELLSFFMEGRPATPELDLYSLSQRLDGFSVADVRALVEEAARMALFLGKAPISQAILGEAMSRVPASITRDTERRFEKFITSGYAG